MELQIYCSCTLRIYSNDDDKCNDGIIDDKCSSDDNGNNNDKDTYTRPQVDADDNHPRGRLSVNIYGIHWIWHQGILTYSDEGFVG